MRNLISKLILVAMTAMFLAACREEPKSNVSTSQTNTNNSTATDPAVAKLVGKWSGTDGEITLTAEFKANGTYIEQGDVNYKTTFTISNNTIHFVGDCNVVNMWNNDYTITYNSSTQMTWTNATMDKWGQKWVWTKISGGSSDDDNSNPSTAPGTGDIAKSFAGGSGTKADPYQIATISQLRFLGQECDRGVSYKGKYVVLTADIRDNAKVIDSDGFLAVSSASLRLWSTIGAKNQVSFEGTFDGQGHSISGIYNPNGCLFYRFMEAEVKNLTIKDSYYCCLTNTFAGGRIENFINYATAAFGVSIVGNTNFVNCGNYGRCGLAGFTNRHAQCFVNCFNFGIISEAGIEELTDGLYKVANGFADICTGNVLNCMNMGPVENETAGVGLVRFISGGGSSNISVSNCVNYGEIKAFGGDKSGAIVSVSYEGSKRIKFYNLYWLETSCRYWFSGNGIYPDGERTGDLFKMDEDYAKSDEFLQKLNENAQKLGTTYSKWKRGHQGYPILEIVNDKRYAL